MKIASVILALLCAVPVLAQDDWLSSPLEIGRSASQDPWNRSSQQSSRHSWRGSSQRIGSITYADYYTPRGRVTASYETIGSITYGRHSDGGRSSSQRIGSIEYHDYTPPARSSYRRFGR